MKKIIALMTAVMLIVCGLAFAEETAMTGMANPWVEMDSLEALNEAAGTNLQLPGVMGITNEEYRLLNTDDYKLAEVCFDVNGMPYTLRSAAVTDDISGVYMDDGKTAFEDREAGDTDFVMLDNEKLARWFNTEGQFVLIVEDNNEMSREAFEDVVSELVDLTNPAQLAVLPEGTWKDRTNENISAEIKALDGNRYSVTVTRKDSDSQATVWTMTGLMCEDDSLIYDDCVEELVETGADGTETRTPADLIPDGSFMLNADSELEWNGAVEEACRNCVFVYNA